jgi:hypothetical protein
VEALGWLVGSGIARTDELGGGCSAAAAGARAPASRQHGQENEKRVGFSGARRRFRRARAVPG